MGIKGRKRRLASEDEYWALILSGVGTVKTCRLVGVGRKNKCRWRAELDGLASARKVEAQESERYLSLLEQERIAVLRRQGMSMRAITLPAGTGALDTLRELRRHTVAHDRAGYDPVLAHAGAQTAT